MIGQKTDCPQMKNSRPLNRHSRRTQLKPNRTGSNRTSYSHARGTCRSMVKISRFYTALITVFRTSTRPNTTPFRGSCYSNQEASQSKHRRVLLPKRTPVCTGLYLVILPAHSARLTNLDSSPKPCAAIPNNQVKILCVQDHLSQIFNSKCICLACQCPFLYVYVVLLV